MTWLDRIKGIFTNEAKEVQATVEDLSARADADLTRREAELAATPAQKLDGVLDEIAESDSAFDEIRAKAAGEGA